MKNIFIAVLLITMLGSTYSFAQLKKCKLKVNKVDDFTSNKIIESFAYDFGIDGSKSILNPIKAQANISGEGQGDSIQFYLSITLEIPNNRSKKNPYKINIGDKLFIKLENDQVVELISVEEDIGKMYSNYKTIEKFTCFVTGKYQIKNKFLKDLKELEVEKYRIEVNGDSEWTKKYNIDMQIPVSEKGIFRFNHRVILINIFNCIEEKLTANN
jgi:hypothetical protein